MKNNQFMVCDQLTERIAVYDADRAGAENSLDGCEVWSVSAGHTAGLKYREKTVFGDVILIAGVFSRILTYPEGKCLWQTKEQGNNYHSIEILPSGNMVLADSNGLLRFFRTSALLTGEEVTVTDLALSGAHGALWDPEYGVLWALGHGELTAYRVQGTGTGEELLPDRSYPLPESWIGGHDLAADLTSLRHLYLSCNLGVMRFDKDTGVFDREFPQYDKFHSGFVKAIGNNREGNFFYCYANGLKDTPHKDWRKAGWLTDRIHFLQRQADGTLAVRELTSEKGAFYKCRVFFGQYQ